MEISSRYKNFKVKKSKKTKLKCIVEEVWAWLGDHDITMPRGYPIWYLTNDIKLMGVQSAETTLFTLKKEKLKCSRIEAWRGEAKKQRAVLTYEQTL